MSDITIKNIYSFINNENKTLTGDEQKLLNSIFQDVDRKDENGKTVADKQGDGKLNTEEWSQFKTTLKTSYQELYEKLTSFIKKTNEDIDYDYFTSNKNIDPDMFTPEMLKKKFPEDKYNIEQNEYTITVVDKNTNDLVLEYFVGNNFKSVKYTKNKSQEIEVYYNENNNISSEQEWIDISGKNNYVKGSYIFYDYDTNVKVVNYNKVSDLDTGKVIEEHKDGYFYQYADNGSYAKTNDETGERTYFDKNDKVQKEDINPNTFAYVIRKCKSKEELDKLLTDKFIGKDAVQIFGDTHCHNLITNLYLEYCENNEEAMAIRKNLYEKAIKEAEKEGCFVDDLRNKDTISYSISKLRARVNSQNGELKEEPITKDIKINQGLTGNCWLLDKIVAMAQTENGLEILNKMYKPVRNSDGSIKSVKVTIQGKEYDIPIVEIKGSTELSNGNLYVRAIEIGVFKYLEKMGVEHTFGVQDRAFLFDGMGGGNSSMGGEILVGNGIEVEERGSIKVVADKTKKVGDDFMQELMNTQNAIISVSTTKTGYKAYVMETGEFENIISHHAYSVVNKDDNFIYIIEPSDNKKTLRMTYDEFKKCFEAGDITMINQPRENDEKVIAQSGAIFVNIQESNPEKRQEAIENQVQKIKADLEERFGSSKYNVEVVYNGRYFEYNVSPKVKN